MTRFLIIFLSAILTGCFSPAHDSTTYKKSIENSQIVSNHVEIPGTPEVRSTPELSSAHDKSSKIHICKDFRVERDHDTVNKFNLVNIVSADEDTKVIRLPTDLTFPGFGLNSARKTKNGFLFSISYGSRYYYGKEFHFVCEKGRFYLTKILVDTHDQADVEKSYKEFTLRIKPRVPLDKFSVAAYMPE